MPSNNIGYFSTNEAIFDSPDLERKIKDRSLKPAGLAEAIITGQAPDGGLFMPTNFPAITMEEMNGMKKLPYSAVFTKVMRDFFKGILFC